MSTLTNPFNSPAINMLYTDMLEYFRNLEDDEIPEIKVSFGENTHSVTLTELNFLLNGLFENADPKTYKPFELIVAVYQINDLTEDEIDNHIIEVEPKSSTVKLKFPNRTLTLDQFTAMFRLIFKNSILKHLNTNDQINSSDFIASGESFTLTCENRQASLTY